MARQPDLSEFFRLSKPKQKPCAVAFAREQLGEPERAQLDAALATDKGLITGAAIRQWLEARNQNVNDSQIGVHRRGVCSCGRDA